MTEYLTTMDRVSKIALAKAIASKWAAKVTTEAQLEMTGLEGQPTLIVADEGREFRSINETNRTRDKVTKRMGGTPGPTGR